MDDVKYGIAMRALAKKEGHKPGFPKSSGSGNTANPQHERIVEYLRLHGPKTRAQIAQGIAQGDVDSGLARGVTLGLFIKTGVCTRYLYEAT